MSCSRLHPSVVLQCKIFNSVINQVLFLNRLIGLLRVVGLALLIWYSLDAFAKLFMTLLLMIERNAQLYINVSFRSSVEVSVHGR